MILSKAYQIWYYFFGSGSVRFFGLGFFFLALNFTISYIKVCLFQSNFIFWEKVLLMSQLRLCRNLGFMCMRNHTKFGLTKKDCSSPHELCMSIFFYFSQWPENEEFKSKRLIDYNDYIGTHALQYIHMADICKKKMTIIQ